MLQDKRWKNALEFSVIGHCAMISLGISIAVAILLAIAASRFLGLFLVQGESMLPTLQEGEWVLARHYLPWEKPLKGEIIILLQEAFPPVLIKRLLAGPGEMLPKEIPPGEGPLPEGHYLLAGDNVSLNPSADYIGPIEKRQIWGKACLVIWPRGHLRRPASSPVERI